MTQANSNFYLDYKVPLSVIKSDTAPVPTPRDTIVDKVNQTTEDIRQMVAAKAWFYFTDEGLIEGESYDEREQRFRELLDSEQYRSFLHVMRKHTVLNELRTIYHEGASVEKQIYDSALNAAYAVSDGGQKPLDKTYATRLVCLDLLLDIFVNNVEAGDATYSDLLLDPNWEAEFEAIEDNDRLDAVKTLRDMIEQGGDVAEAVFLMQELQERKEKGLPCNLDSYKSKLKRLRKATGLPLKVPYLNE
jgi:hypothetical protein